MILTDREIQSSLRTGQITIKPDPKPDAYSYTSLDLTLAREICIWTSDDSGPSSPVVAPAESGFNFGEFATQQSKLRKLSSRGFVLEPNALILAWTRESIGLPVHSRIAARIEGKSSLARLGIAVHVTAPTIHAGFSGQIQLEVCDHGRWRVRLQPGMRVCQLIFEQTLGTPDKGYAGQFKSQKASDSSRANIRGSGRSRPGV